MYKERNVPCACGHHSIDCHHSDEDCMKYALLQLTDTYMALIDAAEMCFFDELLEKEKIGDIELDEESIKNISEKVVYGALMVNHTIMESTKAIDIVGKMAGNFGHVHITKDKATLCQYSAIRLFPELALRDSYIPFAALMKIPYCLQNMDFSITLTPVISGSKEKEFTMWEYMVNRPFLLACRDETEITNEELTPDNFVKFIDEEKMLEAYRLADIVLRVEEAEDV